MRASKDAGRPSLMAISPRNLQLSASRRVKLLAGFNQLDEDERADLLEAAESFAWRAPVGPDLDRDDLREVFRNIYSVADLRSDEDRLPGRWEMCAFCERAVTINKNGRLRLHSTAEKRTCDGSGRKASDMAAVAAERGSR